jgi:hypothetical protein
MEYRGNEESREPMVPAVDVDGLARNLQQIEGLSPVDRAIYIEELYEDQIAILRDRFLSNRDFNATEYVSGQMGCGKSTAFTFFANQDLKAQFEVLHLKPSDTMDTSTWQDPEVNVVEVLIHIGESLFHEAKRHNAQKFILKHAEYFRSIAKNIQESLNIEITNSGSDIQDWAAAIFKFFTNFNLERSYKRVVREQYRNRDIDLVEVIDQMIADFEIDIAKKPLLLIIDDWEKLKDSKALRSVFEVGMPFLRRLKCKKLIPIPAHLRALRIGKDFYSNAIDFIIKIRKNALQSVGTYDETEEASAIAAGKGSLTKVLMARISPERRADLVAQDAIALALEKSGGIVRQFLKIMLEASATARLKKSDTVRLEHVQSAVKLMSGSMSQGVVFEIKMIQLLDHVLRKHQPHPDSSSELIVDAFVNTFIYLNMNGVPCFHVNPLVENSVRAYGQQQ